MASVRHLEFAKFRFFVKCPSWELKCTSAYQICSKSDISRLRYGDNAIFKMAAVRHLDLAKIAVLVRWPISTCDLSSLFQISRWSPNMAPRYSQKTIFNMASVRHLQIWYDVIILHPETAFHVPNLVLNFHGVRFRNFLNIYLVFQVSAFWLEITYFGLNFDDFWWKIGKNVKAKYSNPQNAHPWRKTRPISVEWWRFISRRDL